MLEHLGEFTRTGYCAELSAKNIGETVRLSGWVDSTRDHGGVVFVDLRDRSGKVQVVFSPDISRELVEKAKKLRDEFVIAVSGKVRRRPEGTENPKLRTGEIEVYADELKILNRSLPLPFPVEDDINVGEDLRLKFRYLDLRRGKMLKNLIFRHRLYQITREVFTREGFIEVETPLLTKSTPEGARDFLVPSRIYPGKFYALPQSPQLFKQILMIAGIDRYFQIARCLRDEDLRADRQPEFTQIDFEMSFVKERDVMDFAERLIIELFRGLKGVEIESPIPVMDYDEAMERYGTDRPDIRFGLELKNVTEIARGCSFKVFRSVVERGGIVKAINFKGGASLSRKEIDELTEFAGIYGAKGLAWIKVLDSGLQSPIVKFFTEGEMNEILKKVDARVGDIIFFVADTPEVVNHALSNLRVRLAKMADLIDESEVRLLWVVNFPMFEWNEDEGRWETLHHPFTSPKEEDVDKVETDPSSVRARAYDMVLNGVEIGGGSIRIHRPDIQEKVFRTIGLSDEEARERFGFLVEALKYGAPPHGGMAFGLDRLCAIMLNEETIRDVIPFPKTQRGQCLLTEAPDTVRKEQLDDLHLRVKE